MTQQQPSSFLNGVQVVWDATSISLAEACLRKYQYRLIDGWAPKRASVHLRFGGHYATALEHYYKHIQVEGMDKHEAMRAVVREALEATWDRTEEDQVGKAWQSDDPNKTRETLIRSIIWYLAEFEDEDIRVVSRSDGVPMVEYSFMLPVDNDIIFSGHLDRVVNYSGDNYVMDQKTAKATLSSYYFDKYDLSTQMSMYTFAGQAILSTPIKGVIIDAAQIAVGFTKFARGYTFRTEAQLSEWYNDSLFWIAQAQQATRDGYFPMNRSSCDMYGGCEFANVCKRNASVRPMFLEGDFIKGEPWNPAARR